MRPQRGFALLQVGLMVAAIAAVGGIVYLVKDYLEDERSAAHKAGREAALLEVAQRDNTQLAAVQKRVLELQAELQAKEAAHQDAVARIDQEGTNALRNVEKERDAARRTAARYAGRLRDPGGRPPDGCSPGGGGGAPPAAIAGAGVGDGSARPPAAGSELSLQAGEFLRAEADRADEVVHERNAIAVRLEACQGIVREDRRG